MGKSVVSTCSIKSGFLFLFFIAACYIVHILCYLPYSPLNFHTFGLLELQTNRFKLFLNDDLRASVTAFHGLANLFSLDRSV